MGFQDIIALTVAAGAVVFVARALWRTMHAQGGCACSHVKRNEGCGSATAGRASGTGIKRLPLISIDQIGKPYDSRSSGRSGKIQ